MEIISHTCMQKSLVIPTRQHGPDDYYLPVTPVTAAVVVAAAGKEVKEFKITQRLQREEFSYLENR